jgi:hypothetical protein
VELTRNSGWKWTIRHRRMAALFATFIIVLVWLAGAQAIRNSLGHPAIYSGATLLFCLLALMMLGLRKRLIVLPLWPVKTWVQIHIYMGLFACAAFVVHVPTLFASGRLEAPLSWLFIVVSLSGFYGLYISRSAPKRLSSASIEPRYDRIPWHRDQIALAAQKTVAELADSPDREILRALYVKALEPYFNSSLPLRYLLHPSSIRRRRLIQAVVENHRYLDQSVLAAANRLSSLVRHRDDLDFQHAIQFRLRTWVTFHSAIASLLIVWSLVHAYLAIGMLGE